MPKYSIVVPLHNEQENVTDLYDRLKAVMEANGETFEIVLVDDGSTDRSFHMLREIAAVDSRVTVVKLRRNFGQTSALAAGFDHARGEYIIAMDGDLQHDPADIPIFLEKISEGYDIVSGWRKRRIDNFWLRRFPSRMRQLADGQAERCGHSRLWDHFQSLSPGNSGYRFRSTASCTALSRRWPRGTGLPFAKCRSRM